MERGVSDSLDSGPVTTMVSLLMSEANIAFILFLFFLQCPVLCPQLMFSGAERLSTDPHRGQRGFDQSGRRADGSLF